jgi:hypothetical protein
MAATHARTIPGASEIRALPRAPRARQLHCASIPVQTAMARPATMATGTTTHNQFRLHHVLDGFGGACV